MSECFRGGPALEGVEKGRIGDGIAEEHTSGATGAAEKG
jgi:hypothetical protein